MTEAVRNRQRANTLILNRIFFLRSQKPHKVVSITQSRLEGYRTVIRNAYIIKSGDELRFRCRYTYSGMAPDIVVVQQSIDGEAKTLNVLFTGKGSYYDLDVTTKVSGPKNVVCKAYTKPKVSVPIQKMRKYNELTQTYPVGLFDERPKPVSEYPVSDASNAVLDLPYSWSVGNSVYPEPVLPGLSFTDMSVGYSGFLRYEDKYYKDPTRNNSVVIAYRIVNDTAYDLSVSHYGLLLSVLYEDNRHVSQVNIGVDFPSFTLNKGQYKDCSISVNLPSWAYGRVAMAHALNFYDRETGMLKYVGGPFYRFEIFRLRLP